MRVLFFGTAAFAIPSLERLVAEGHQVVRCVTQPDRPQGRGMKVLPSPVKEAAGRLGLSVETPERLDAAVEAYQRVEADLGVVISYGRLIPATLLRLPRQGMVGVHPSLLPKHRGASPIAWAILNGEQTTGVTVFRLSERLDAGGILLQQTVSIEPQETTERLSQRLALLGADLLLTTMAQLQEGMSVARPQDEQHATFAPKLTKAHGRIDWQASAATIDRLVRAAVPWPGAYTGWRGQSLKVLATRYDSRNHTRHGRPGEILSASGEGVAVATGEGELVIQALQLSGRRRMTAQEFLAGHRIQVGEMLGSGE